MQRKMGVVAGIVIMAGLVVMLVLLTTTSDSEGPVISFEEGELFYNATMDESVLLQGVQALDDEDGDVSDSLMIQNINYSSDTGGVVVYVARDSSNNVTTCKRKFTCQSDVPVDPAPADGNGDVPQDIVPADPQAGTPEAVSPEGLSVPEQAGTEYEAIKQQQLNQGYPFIWLTQRDVTIQSGSEFIIQSYIAEILNAGEDPYRRIQVNGDRVNADRAGTYQMEIYVTDESGNLSNRETLRVTVT